MNRLIRTLRWLIWLPALCWLSACIQVDVRFDIRPDGSGQVTETYRVRDDASWLPAGASPLAAYLSPMRLSERAMNMAPGITVAGEVIPKQDRHHVAQVTYEVPDFQGLVWRFGQRPLPDSLSYRFELNRKAGQPLRVDVVNDPFVTSLGRVSPQDNLAMQKAVEAIEAMSGVQVNVQVVSQGELLKSTGRWQSGQQTTLFDVRADELLARAGWQDRLRQAGTGAGNGAGIAACHTAEDPALRMDCQPRISLWLR